MKQETRSTCPYCGVGCGVVIEHDEGEIVGVRGDPEHPANFGQLCTKGSTLHLTARAPARAARLLHPMMRTSRSAPHERASWDRVLDLFASPFAASIAEHGPDSVAFYISGQLLTEDYYVFNKLAKGLIGTNNVDSNSRLCMSSAVSGYKATLGSDAPPACYADVDHARCLFIAGSNTAWAHPVLHRRIEAAKACNPDLRIIVVDPRRTVTAASADLHLAIEPGTDVALFHGMLHVMLWEGREDRAFIAQHTEGFDALRAAVREYTPRAVAQLCGVSEDALVRAAHWFAEGPTLSLYCQGLNQSSSGTDKNAALINLHLATGQIGKPGAGPFSLTGQPNAMGGREVGGMATLSTAHRELSNPQDRAELARLWGVPSVPEHPGVTAVELFDALAAGRVRIVWIACTNPAQSLPDQQTVRAGLARAELVVLQEAYADTETTAYADVLLPASSWGEKEGTATNSERRISRVRRAIDAPGEARADWAIAASFARRLERHLRPGAAPLFEYETAAQVFDEHAATTEGRDLDVTALSHAALDALGPQQWPCPRGSTVGTARLYMDGRFATPTGRARFAAVAYRPVAENVDARYPIKLTTGRLRDQWHGMTRTGTLAGLYAHAPEPALELNASDVSRRGLVEGDLVVVESRRGTVVVPVRVSDAQKPGCAFLPMHWGSHALAGRGSAGVNAVSARALCAQSRQPELKHAAVRITKFAARSHLVAFAHPADANDLVVLRHRLRGLVGELDFACVVLLAGSEPGVLLRAASSDAMASDALDAIDECLGLVGEGVLRYDDSRRGVGRRMKLRNGRLHAVRLIGDCASEAWLREWFVAGVDVSSLRARLLVPSTEPPAAFRARGRTICNCLAVSESAIVDVSGRTCGIDDALAAVQSELRCGTQCGSCLPEVRAIVAQHARRNHGLSEQAA